MSRLLKTVSIYFLGNVINRLMGFIVMSVATHVLTDSDLGYFSMSSTLINITMTLVSVQAWMAIIRFVFDYDTIEGKRKIIANGYFIEFVTFVIYTIGFIIFLNISPIADAFELYLLSFGYVFNQGVQFACRGLGKNKLYVISGIVGSTAQLLSSILFMFVFHMTSNALILAMALSYICQGLFIEISLKSFRNLKLSDINLKLAKDMLKYCVPTALNYGAYWVNQSANVIIIGFCISKSAAGIFTAAFKMNSLIGIVMMAFNFAFQEYSFSINRSDIKEKMYNKMFDSFIRFISCGMMFLLPVTSILFALIIGPSYESARSLVPLLYLGSFFDSLQLFLSSIMQAEKKVELMFFSQMIGAIITFTVMLNTVWFFGLQSAGIAMIACFAAVSAIRIIGLKPKIKLKFKMSYFLHYIIVFLITVFVYLNFNEIVNLIYCIPLTIYCLFCMRSVIKQIFLSFSKRYNNKKEY